MTGTVHPQQVLGSGSSYTVVFESPLIAGGVYTLQLAPTIADVAGNVLGSGVADTFQLLPDVTPPTVTSVTPTGIVASNVSSLTVTFDEAIDPATFTSDQLTLQGPGGTIATAAITVTALNATQFTVAFPATTQDGVYSVTLGTGIADISGKRPGNVLPDLVHGRHEPADRDRRFANRHDSELAYRDRHHVLQADQICRRFAAALRLTSPNGAITLGNPFLVSGTTTTYGVQFDALANQWRLHADGRAPALPTWRASRQAEPKDFFFTVSLPALVVDTPVSQTPSATFGDTVLLTYTVHNEGTAPLTTNWTDNIYLSASPFLDWPSADVSCGSYDGGGGRPAAMPGGLPNSAPAGHYPVYRQPPDGRLLPDRRDRRRWRGSRSEHRLDGRRQRCHSPHRRDFAHGFGRQPHREARRTRMFPFIQVQTF